MSATQEAPPAFTHRDGLGILTLLVSTVAALLPRPQIDNSVAAITATNDRRADVYDTFRSRFGADEVVVVRLEAETPQALAESLPEVEDVLNDIPPIERLLSPGEVYPDELLLLEDSELLDDAALARVQGRLQGPLGRSLALLELEPPSATVYAFGVLADPAVWREARSDLAALSDRLEMFDVRLVVGGSPFVNLALDEEGEAVDGFAVPVLVTVSVGLLWLLLRSLRLLLCVLLPVGLLVLGVDGVYAALGFTGNLVVNVAKPLLFVISLASGLHVVVAYDHLRSQPDCTRQEAAWAAASEKARGVALALLTTAIGFSSLMLAEITPIRYLGGLAAAGLAAAGPIILFGVPTLLARFGPAPRPSTGRKRLEDALEGLVAASIRHRIAVIATAAAVVVGGAASLFHLRPSTHPIAYFPEQHSLRKAHAQLDAKGAGLMTLEVMLEGPPASLEALDRFAATATTAPKVRGRVDRALLFREAGFRSSGRDAVPNPALVDLLLQERPELGRRFRAGDSERVALLLDPATTAYDLDTVSRAVREAAAKFLPEHGLVLTGNFDLIVRSQLSLQKTLVSSLAVTLLLMELVLLLALRSVRLALMAVVPNVLPVAVNAILMFLLGIPLDVGTAMTGAVALGIAVDDTLHFLVAWREEGERPAIRRTGRALVLSTVVIAMGFFALVPSSFLPTRNFALLAGTAMAVALIADLTVLPALLSRRSDAGTLETG